MLEIEKRGRLDQDTLKRLRQFLTENGTLVKKCDQLNIFIEFDNQYLGEIENTKASINISITRDIINNTIYGLLKTKKGNMQSSARIESAIPFPAKNIADVYSFLKVFQIGAGCPRFYNREDYIYKDLTISIKEKGLAPDHFEVERTVDRDDPELLTAAEKEIDEFLQKLNLSCFSEQEYKEMMLRIFKENPPIPFEEIDLGLVI